MPHLSGIFRDANNFLATLTFFTSTLVNCLNGPYSWRGFFCTSRYRQRCKCLTFLLVNFLLFWCQNSSSTRFVITSFLLTALFSSPGFCKKTIPSLSVNKTKRVTGWIPWKKLFFSTKVIQCEHESWSKLCSLNKACACSHTSNLLY